MAQNRHNEIFWNENEGDVTVRVNGVSVQIHPDGSILACTNGPIKVCPVANDDGKAGVSREPKIGDKMPDGTVSAGISPDTNKPMYATPEDAPLMMTFNEAKEYTQDLNVQKAHGRGDWHMPTKAELNVLFNNRAAIGGFNVTGSDPAGWYWSSTQNLRWVAWGQRFSDGAQNYYYKYLHSSVRCVR